MIKKYFGLIGLFSGMLIVFSILGCSKSDNNPIIPPSDHQVNIRLKAGSFWIFNRWDLDMTNNKIDSTKRTYNVEIRGNGGLTLGAYTDWFYRIGTDTKTAKQDTAFIRTEPTTSDLQVYGFQSGILKQFITLANTYFKVGYPTIPTARWDLIGRYTGTAGTDTWNISDPNGTQLNFTISGFPVTVTITIVGKYEAKAEIITVNQTPITTYKSSASITLDILGTKKTMVAYFWFADTPSGQIKLFQQSLTLSLGPATVPIVGETQELVSYSL